MGRSFVARSFLNYRTNQKIVRRYMFAEPMKSDWKIETSQNKYISKYIGTDLDKEWREDFYFVQGSDPQFGCHDFFKNPNYDPHNPDWTFEINLAKIAINRVNEMSPQPKFFVICGDLTNEYPTDSEETKKRQIDDFKEVFSQLRKDIPLVCVCGNHDIGNKPTIDSINKYRSEFGCDFFSFWCGGVLFLVLNSQYYVDPEKVADCAAEQEVWLDSQLEEGRGKKIICFSHIPWFVKDLDEVDTAYNIPLETRKRQLDKLYRAGVRQAFCGHLHANAISFYKDLEIIATSAIGAQFGLDVSGLRVVKVEKNTVKHVYIGLEDTSRADFSYANLPE